MNIGHIIANKWYDEYCMTSNPSIQMDYLYSTILEMTSDIVIANELSEKWYTDWSDTCSVTQQKQLVTNYINSLLDDTIIVSETFLTYSDFILEADSDKEDVSAKLSYWKSVLMLDETKNKFALSVLQSIEKSNGKATKKQKDIINRAVTGNSSPYHSKN